MKLLDEPKKETIDLIKSFLSSSNQSDAFSFQTVDPKTNSNFTIVGLEEFVLEINENNVITYVNDGMAKLLGAESKKEIIKNSLLQWDGKGFVDSFFLKLVESIRQTGKACIIERTLPKSIAERLKIHISDLATDPLFRFVATPVRQKIQIILQDITHVRWLEKSFSRYVSPQVIDKLRSIPEEELLRPERRIATVLFADLRGFTSVCQEMIPTEVAEMLNAYFVNMVDCIEKYEGTVDKFIGDQVMAIFGAPLACADHALRALLTALLIVETHSQWQSDRKKKGLFAPSVGIGIATGEVVIGNVGTPRRMDYTALGHTVNLAARLCNKAETMEILTVRNTYESALFASKNYPGPEKLPHFQFEHKGHLKLKNILNPVSVLRVKA
jgi:class 3 adenylate cyclase